MSKQYKSQEKYDEKYTKRFTIKLNIKTDKEILDFLENQSSKQGTIKEALKLLLERQKND